MKYFVLAKTPEQYHDYVLKNHLYPMKTFWVSDLRQLLNDVVNNTTLGIDLEIRTCKEVEYT